MTNAQTQKGVALIQAIVLAAVLSIIALFLNSSAKNSVESAQLLSDRARAHIELYNAEAELTYDIMTHPLENGRYRNDKTWYFFGKPFSYKEGVDIAIQDEAGLVSLSPLASSLTERLIRRLGYEQDVARTTVDSIQDWQDDDDDIRQFGGESGDYNFGPRNRPLAELAEINWIPQIPKALRTELEDYLSIFNSGYFNPVNAPEPVLEAYLQTDRLSSAVQNFRLGESSSDSFQDVANVEEEEGVYFYTSSLLRIKLQAEYGGARVARQVTVAVDPYSDAKPNVYKVIQSMWGQRALINTKELNNELNQNNE